MKVYLLWFSIFLLGVAAGFLMAGLAFARGVMQGYYNSLMKHESK